MDQFSAHLDRGWDLVARGDLAGAMVSARKSVELNEAAPEAHNLLGYVHAAEGQAEDALEHYRRAIELDETFVEAMLNAGEILVHPMQDFEGALRMADDALEYCQTKEEIADALLLKVEVLLNSDEPEQAAALVRSLPEGPFDNEQVEFLVGRAHYEVGDVEGADPLIRRAAAHKPDDPEAQYYLGLVLDASGDEQGAAVAFLRTRELDLQVPAPAWSPSAAQFERNVQQAIGRLPATLADKLEGALVAVGDLPSIEVVSEGVDPRAELLVEDYEETTGRVGRLFAYRRNVERNVGGPFEIEDELVTALERELEDAVPDVDVGEAEAAK